MIWLLANWRLLLGATLALATFAFAFGFRTGANSVQQDWDKERHARVTEYLAAVEQNQKTITELQGKYAKSTADLERLRAAPAGRVRLPKPACPEAATAASGVAVSTPSTERTSDQAQSALGEAQQGMESDAIEWARALNACAVVMEWAKGLGK